MAQFKAYGWLHLVLLGVKPGAVGLGDLVDLFVLAVASRAYQRP